MRQGRWQEAYDVLKPGATITTEFDILLMFLAAKLDKLAEVPLEFCLEQINGMFGSYDALDYMPRGRNPRDYTFVTALAALTILSEGHPMHGFFLRQAEDVYPDNPILCCWMVRSWWGTWSASVCLPYIERGLPYATGKLKDFMERDKRLILELIERDRRGGR